MGAHEAQFMKLRLANDFPGRTINENGCIKITVTTTHATTQLPVDWRSASYIWIVNTHSSAYLEIAQTLNSGAEINLAAAAPATAMVGTYIPPSTRMRFELESWDETKPCFLVYEGSSAGMDVRFERGS